MRLHIRWMIRRDMPEIIAIEQQSFKDGWTEEDFLRALRNRNSIGMVCEDLDCRERIVGYIVYELHKTKLELLKFAVHFAYRRRGVGRAMLEELASKLSSHRRTRIALRVPETNLPAQLFFRANGFRATAVERGYCGEEDAYRMAYRLPVEATAA